MQKINYQSDSILAGILRWMIWILLFLLPFKFGWFVCSQESANFPLDIWQWVFFTIWPKQLLWGISLLIFGASVLACRKNDRYNSGGRWIVWLGILPLLAGLIGLIATTEWNYAIAWLGNFGAAAALAAAVYLLALSDRKILPGIAVIFAVTGLLCAVHGWYQHFVGLSADLVAMQEYARQQGFDLSNVVIDKLSQTRIHGSFVDPNIYAAYLLLTGPLTIGWLWRLGGHFEPKKLSSWILSLLGVAVIGMALVWSGSRSAILGAGGIAGALLWCKYASRANILLRIGVVVVLLGVMLGGIVMLSRATERDFSTASVRIEYYGTALKMAAMKPWTGVGLGEFYPWHLRLKPAGADSARDAHSQFFMLLAQCGVVGGLVSLLRLMFPVLLLLGWQRLHQNRQAGIFIGAVAGWIGWNIHSLFQFDDVVPAMACGVAVIGFLAIMNADDNEFLPAEGKLASVISRIASILAIVLGIVVFVQMKVEVEFQRGADMLQQYPNSPGLARKFLTCDERITLQAPYPYLAMGTAEMGAGQYGQAVENWEKLVKLTPHRALFWRSLGDAYKANGQLVEAEEAYSQARIWYPNIGGIGGDSAEGESKK